jgi:hypothetical protein
MPLSHEHEHALKNYLAIILGFAEILVAEAGDGDPHREDLLEIHRAALAAAKLVSRPPERQP